jgi:hypothetical protein
LRGVTVVRRLDFFRTSNCFFLDQQINRVLADNNAAVGRSDAQGCSMLSIDALQG